MIFMAASMLAACSESNTNEQPQAGDPGYISTNGEGVDVDNMEIDRTTNTVENTTVEEAVTPEEAEETRLRKVITEEQERVSYWTVEESSITPEAESVRGNLDQMEQNFIRIEGDLKNAETGTYNPQGRLSREAQQDIKEARATVAKAKQKLERARQQYDANKYEQASEQIKEANKALTNAREDYMEALEKETGVKLEPNVD